MSHEPYPRYGHSVPPGMSDCWLSVDPNVPHQINGCDFFSIPAGTFTFVRLVPVSEHEFTVEGEYTPPKQETWRDRPPLL